MTATRGERAALGGLLAGSAALYLVNLTVNGMANGFYSAAVWAGSLDTKAWFFGSTDPGNFATVDKPPLALWIMGLSARLFGFSSASLLVPQALIGVASVWFTYAVTARASTRRAGLLAGAALAVLPAAGLMFRYDNPDAVMTLLMTVSAYAVIRALTGSSWWLVLAGAATGLAFLAKTLQALIAVPGLALAYLLVASVPVARRMIHLALAGAALVVTAGSYVVVTMLWPTQSRPYIGGSSDNTFLDLAFGYNGLGRVGGTTNNAPGVNPPGPFRLLSGEFGIEIGWFLPAAVIALGYLGSRALARRGADGQRPELGLLVLAGGWLLVGGAMISFMTGTTHAYYALSIAPAVAMLVGLGADAAWSARATRAGLGVLAALLIATTGYAVVLTRAEAPNWQAWLPVVTVLAAVVALALLRAGGDRPVPAPTTAGHPGVIVTAALATAALVAAFLTPTAYSIHNMFVAHAGASPMAAPGVKPAARVEASDNPALDALLRASSARWAAATPGGQAGAALQLNARVPVLTVGGYSSNDDVPTLERFVDLATTHQIGSFVAPRTDNATGAAKSVKEWVRKTARYRIEQWVAARYPAQQVGQDTIYRIS